MASLSFGALLAAISATSTLTDDAGGDSANLVLAGGLPGPGSAPTASLRRLPDTGGGAPNPSGAPQAAFADWARSMSSTTGAPARALEAYALAQQRLAREQPDCHVSWATLAGIGYVESGNGQFGGGLLESGRPLVPIIGVSLTGSGGVASVADSDHGELDGDATVDHAVGPLQFLPSTWLTWGADGDRDGLYDPQDIDDAALAAARYLCNAGDLASATGWTAAVLSYNHSDAYVVAVSAATNTFAQRSLAASPG